MAKKDRLLHPTDYLRTMLPGWDAGDEAAVLTCELLGFVESSRLDEIARFSREQRSTGELLGSAFWQVVTFAGDYLERFADRPGPAALLERLSRARAALSGRGHGIDIVVLERDDQAPPVAFVVSVDRPGPSVVVPLAAGRSVVGRSVVGQPLGVWPEPHAAEQALWLIDCRADSARVWDASPTGGSVLVRNEVVFDSRSHGETIDFTALTSGPAAEPIGRASGAAAQDGLALRDGDMLAAHAAFIFSWL